MAGGHQTSGQPPDWSWKLLQVTISNAHHQIAASNNATSHQGLGPSVQPLLSCAAAADAASAAAPCLPAGSRRSSTRVTGPSETSPFFSAATTCGSSNTFAAWVTGQEATEALCSHHRTPPPTLQASTANANPAHLRPALPICAIDDRRAYRERTEAIYDVGAGARSQHIAFHGHRRSQRRVQPCVFCLLLCAATCRMGPFSRQY